MIGYLSGKIISIKPTKLLLDVNGVGYLLNISINTFEAFSNKNVISLFVHTNVKEDAITLFGFSSEKEKEMFELLITVNGIGPKVGLSILSGIQIEDLKAAIFNNNLERLVAIPGIGRKTAERMLLELRTKIDPLLEDIHSTSHIKTEAISALTTLGYNNKLSEKIVRDLISEIPSISIEDLIKKSLGLLNK
jgi:holliday junction DNA helicase RuvA